MGIDLLDIAFRIEKRFGFKMPNDDCAYMSDTVDLLHAYVWARLQGRAPHLNAPFEAFKVYRAWLRSQGVSLWRQLRAGTSLDKMIPDPQRQLAWDDLQARLGCPIPPLELRGGDVPELVFPRNFAKTYELPRRLMAEQARSALDACAADADATANVAEGWTYESSYDALREMLVNALGVDAQDVVPNARLMEDLGMD